MVDKGDLTARPLFLRAASDLLLTCHWFDFLVSFDLQGQPMRSQCRCISPDFTAGSVRSEDGMVAPGHALGGKGRSTTEVSCPVLFLLPELAADQGRTYQEEFWILPELLSAESSGRDNISCWPFPHVLHFGWNGPVYLVSYHSVISGQGSLGWRAHSIQLYYLDVMYMKKSPFIMKTSLLFFA